MSTETITVDFNANTNRRGAIPTPDGALPTRRRSRRGMVNLAAWDAKVAADNETKGTASETSSPTLLQLLHGHQAEAEKNLDGIATALKSNPEPPAKPAPAPRSTGTLPPTSRGAISEDSQIVKTPEINLPEPSSEAVKAAKAALQAELEAATDQLPDKEFVPSPPAEKAAKPQPKNRKP